MITVTSNAVNHIKKLLSSRDSKPLGIKLGIETKGCSGLSYSMEFVDSPDEKDEVLNIEDIKIYIDPYCYSYWITIFSFNCFCSNNRKYFCLARYGKINY